MVEGRFGYITFKDKPGVPAVGNYSHVSWVDIGPGYLLHVAGLTGDDPETGEVVKQGVGNQTGRALNNLDTIILFASQELGTERCPEIGASDEGLGCGLGNVVDMTVIMTNMEMDKKMFEQVYEGQFRHWYEVRNQEPRLPPRTLFEAKDVPLPKDRAVIMLKAVAYLPKEKPSGKDARLE